MTLHLQFNTHQDDCTIIRQYLKDEGYDPIFTTGGDVHYSEDNIYLITCHVPVSKMAEFDKTLVKLITGTDLIKYWCVTETKYA